MWRKQTVGPLPLIWRVVFHPGVPFQFDWGVIYQESINRFKTRIQPQSLLPSYSETFHTHSLSSIHSIGGSMRKKEALPLEATCSSSGVARSGRRLPLWSSFTRAKTQRMWSMEGWCVTMISNSNMDTYLRSPIPPPSPASQSPSRPVKKKKEKKKRLCFEGDVRGNRRTLSYFDVQRGDQTRRILHGHCTSFVPSEGSWVCFPNLPSTRVAKRVLHRPWKQSVDIILTLLAGSEAWKSFVIISHFGSSAFSTLPATPVIFWPDSQLTIYLLTKARVVLVSSSCTFFFYRAFWFQSNPSREMWEKGDVFNHLEHPRLPSPPSSQLSDIWRVQSLKDIWPHFVRRELTSPK